MKNPNRESILSEIDCANNEELAEFRNRFLIALKGILW